MSEATAQAAGTGRRRDIKPVRRRRRWVWPLVTFFVILIALAAWVGIRALLARDHLMKARAEVSRLRADVSNGDVAALPAGLAKVESEARAARDLTGDFIWSGLASLPLLGRTLSSSHDLAVSVDQLVDTTLNPLIRASQEIDPKALRRPDGTIDLARLSAVEPDLAKAETALKHTTAVVNAMDLRGVLSPVVKARNEFTDQLNGLVGTVDTAFRASKIGPAMLGANGPRTYLMVFQTPAESRGTGGLVGSYAIIKVDKGKIIREQTGSNEELKDSPTSVINLGDEFNTRYFQTGETQAWRNANFTPHFPYAAQIWQKLWQKQTGQLVDGVIAVDPIALGYLLDATGPVTLSDGEVISGKNAATWTMVTSYARYANDNNRRKDLNVELATKTLDRLTSGVGRPTAILKALGKSAGERRLLVWTAHSSEEAELSGTPLAGELPSTPGPFVALVVRNASGDKLDYYLQRRLDYRVLSCSATTQTVQITATLTNAAPLKGLPGYVTTRSDGRKVPIGQDRVNASIYAARGAKLKLARLNILQADVHLATERGLAVYDLDIELPIGKPQVFQVTITEPLSKEPLRYLVQPQAKPLTLTAETKCP